MAALLLLLCSEVYTDTFTGEEYTFLSLFYDETAMNALKYGEISMQNILLGYDTSYLWMFCPIIVGIPCVRLKKTERLVLFRTSKNKYFLSKYTTNVFASGVIMLVAYLMYILLGMILVKENIWDVNIVKKLLSVFCWGIISAIPSILLSEYVENKYLILCIPFVLNYFLCVFLPDILSYDIRKYIEPATYQILFLYDKTMIVSCLTVLSILMLVCAGLKKLIMERRCDCGQ